MKKVVCFNVPYDQVKFLEARVAGKFEIDSLQDLSELLSINPSEYSSLFIYLNNDFDAENYEAILKFFGQVPVNTILEDKNFNHLMLSYRYQVNAVFQAMFTQDELEQALLKVELLSENNRAEIPVSQIVKLYSGPVKINSNIDFYNRMAVYFQSFKFSCEFSLVIIVKDHDLELLGANLETDILTQVDQLSPARKYIGEVFHLEEQYFAAPCFLTHEQQVWAIVKVNQAQKSYIFNSLLFKFWESVMLYRSGLLKEKSLERLAKTDEVTGLYNQRKLSEDLEIAVKQHEKQDKKFSLMFIDVDHFKNVNDNHGHVVGSKLLFDIGSELVNILRQSDHVYRYGGDEFVVIMPHVDIDTVYMVANRVLEKIKKTDFEIEGGEIYKLSVSIGIAEYPTDARSALEIIKFADEMMYMSKKSGRGKVFHIHEVDDASPGPQ